jgi:hypothetical protein
MMLEFKFDRKANKETFKNYVDIYFQCEYCSYECLAKRHNERFLWEPLKTYSNFQNCPHLKTGGCLTPNEIAFQKIAIAINALETISLPINK